MFTEPHQLVILVQWSSMALVSSKSFEIFARMLIFFEVTNSFLNCNYLMLTHLFMVLILHSGIITGMQCLITVRLLIKVFDIQCINWNAEGTYKEYERHMWQ